MYQRNFQLQSQQPNYVPQQAYQQLPSQQLQQQGLHGSIPASFVSAKQQVPFESKQTIPQRAPFQQGISQQVPQQQQFQFSGSQGNGTQITNPGFLQASGSTNYTQNTTQNTLGNSRVISPEKRIEEIDSGLQCENEKLNRQYKQLESLLEAFIAFESNKHLADLKTFNSKNQQRFSDLIDEIYDFKAKVEEEKRRGEELRQQSAELKQNSAQQESMTISASGPLLSLQNQELQKKLDSLKDEQNRLKGQFTELENKKTQQEYYLETKEQLDQQIQNLEDTEKMLQSEVNILLASNQKLADQLNKKAFFKEYDFVCKEIKGLKEQNDKVEKEIKVRDEELFKLKGKQEAPFPQCGMGPIPRQ